jgi:hypothetical protein
MERRDFLKGILAAGVAPAVVKAENLMKIYVPPEPDIYTNIVTIGEMSDNPDIIQFGESINPANNGLYQVVDVSHDDYGIVIDADGMTTAELYDEVKRMTRTKEPEFGMIHGGRQGTFVLDRKLKMS